jgi:C_GCAxxG_C_C family probable redox protein
MLLEVKMVPNETDYDKIIKKATELGFDYELAYFGCSQATVAALIEAFGIGGPDLLRASTCLAGGVARRGHVCGAVTGGLLMIGYLTGRDDLAMFPQYQRAMEYGNMFYIKFHEAFGTVNCSEIQKLKFGKAFDLQDPAEREELHQKMAELGTGCQAVTSAGARLAAEVIVEILETGPPLARMLAQGK